MRVLRISNESPAEAAGVRAGDRIVRIDGATFFGRLRAKMGWGGLAVPTGIVTAEMTAHRNEKSKEPTTRTCQVCLTEGHLPEANFCQHCGAQLPEYRVDNSG